MTVHLDLRGLKRLADSDGMRRVLHEAGEAVADNVRAMGVEVGDLTPGTSFQIPLPVDVDADGSVALAHPAGDAVQAKHGALTKAAAEAGLEFRGF